LQQREHLTPILPRKRKREDSVKTREIKKEPEEGAATPDLRVTVGEPKERYD
jgi:hypothetical protein